MRKITLFISAHGLELPTFVNNKFVKHDFSIPNDNITIFNVAGKFGRSSFGSYESINKFRSNLSFSLSINSMFLKTQTNTTTNLDFMKHIQNTYKPIYKDLIIERKNNERIKEVILSVKNGEHCKIYNPVCNKLYIMEPQTLMGHILHKIIGEKLFRIGMIGYLDPLLNDKNFYNKNIYDKSILDLCKTHEEYTKISDIESRFYCNKFSLKYLLLEKSITLDEIITICKILGFTHVDIYDYSCRSVKPNITLDMIEKVEICEFSL